MDGSALTEFESLEIEPLIAAKPAEPRDSSRLISVDRAAGSVEHGVFRGLADLLVPGDVLVLNSSKVWKAKLPARKPTGGRSELLLLKPEKEDLKTWSALARKIQPGQTLICDGGARAVCARRNPDGSFIFDLSSPLDPAYLERNAEVPLPQYILKARKRAGMPEDETRDDFRYQTVFAGAPGSIAAPTAGFHFTPELLDELRKKGVEVRFVTLHIGWGTFKPVRSSEPSAHVMLEEECALSAETADSLNAAKAGGARIIAVGTSSMRTLETFSSADGRFFPGEGKAGCFIYPGYRFKAAGAFLTNLHVPSSAPLYMTAAFAGRELLFKAYKEAVEKKYRFYSYGDSMFIS
ncbi:MAG: tRNA preQ1(34) S-adenosylmethionine ribosyltransferase-isomerase QueA [Elusimicrobiales bacterium]|jgi:S-adenosylmethionine:tRNA ribosyltransferase-isomerase